MFKVYCKAEHLPEVWDEIAGDNIFLHRNILIKLEEENPCSQLYHLSEQEKIALVSYKLRINLFTFTKNFSLTTQANIIGVPMSVAKSGYAFGDQQGKGNGPSDLSKGAVFSTYIKSLKGFWLLLNADDQLSLSQGNTLPSCKMEVRWESFEAYLESMRSHYRYRFKRALQRFAGIKVEELENNSCFDEELYRLYLNVYERSKEKLEKLPMGFFTSFPAKILKFTINGQVVAFVQLVENGEELIFLFGGFKHSINQKYDLYLNMLLQIVAYGLRKDFTQIDFGQTTEETKLKLGALQQPKHLYVHHGNRYINALLSKLVGKFSYRHYQVSHKVFK